MNIDYEKISQATKHCFFGTALQHDTIKEIIEAYEAQKNPEWVPLDLEKVTQGQEVRNKDWPQKPTKHTRNFVATYEGGLVLEHQGYLSKYGHQKPEEWLMRAPKPKTVRVRVYKNDDGTYGATVGAHLHRASYVGEGDIEVKA